VLRYPNGARQALARTTQTLSLRLTGEAADCRGCRVKDVMIIHQAFRYELDPTNIQRGRLASHAGAARYAWNWALEQVKTALDARASGGGTASMPNAIELHRTWNAWKKQPGHCEWWSENSKCAYQEAFRDLDRALKAYWRARRTGRRRVGFPIASGQIDLPRSLLMDLQ
jgi:transposase